MRTLLLVVVTFFSLPALAQKELFFGNGKEVRFREEDMDRRFKKSKFYKMLNEGTDDPNCLQLLGGMLTVLAEIGPTLHARDEKFTLDPTLLQAVNVQLTTPRFPAALYLHSMVRRMLIDKRLPDAWLETAESINATVQIIDVGKLKMINEQIKPIDSFYFSLPALRSRYELEVLRANSAVTTDVAAAFRDAYLMRDVAWGDVALIDTGVKAKKTMAKKSKEPLTGEELGAVLKWTPPDPTNDKLYFHEVKKPPPVMLYVHLAPKQYLDLERVPVGKRMMVRGRFWEMNKAVTEVEIRDALLFEDRDWSQGVVLADPNAVFACPAAVNELTGTAPMQPGGFRH